MQFFNPQAIKVTGALRYPGKDAIVVSDKFVAVGGSIFTASVQEWGGGGVLGQIRG